MHYNVCFESEQTELLEEIIAREDPDILTFNEIDIKKIIVLQNKFIPFFSMKNGKDYGNAIAIKPGTVHIIMPHCTSFSSPVLELETSDYILYLTHLTRKSEEKRLDEIEAILKLEKEEDKDFMIVGDLNSLSPYDNYNLKKIEKEYRRFGKPVKQLVIPRLKDYGLVDLMYIHKTNKPTAPTRNGSLDKRTPIRVDYVFATDRLTAKVRNSYVVKNEITERCSDHYPIVVDFHL